MVSNFFRIPGLFQLNLVIVDLPTEHQATDDRGNRTYLIRKVGFYLQLDASGLRSGSSPSEGLRQENSQRFEGSIVGCEAGLEIPGVEAWTGHTMPPGLLFGNQVEATINGDRGILTFEPVEQSSIIAAAWAGFGDRVRVSFVQGVRGGNAF